MPGAWAGVVLPSIRARVKAEKIADIEPQTTVLDESAVADQVFQAADQHQLEEDHRVERGLAGMAIKGLGLFIEKAPVE
jgi:hypothetical protein